MDIFKKNIIEEKYNSALQLINFEIFELYYEEILEGAFDDGNICYYEFIKYIIDSGHNNSKMHYYASQLMATALNYKPGGYKIAFQHAKIALELSPSDSSLKEYMLLFYDTPDAILSKKEAVLLAKEVLKDDPTSLAAKGVINGR